MFFLGKASTDMDVFPLQTCVQATPLAACHFDGAMRARGHRRGDAAVQEVLKAVYVPRADEDGIRAPLFRLLDEDVRRVAFPADLRDGQTRGAQFLRRNAVRF